MEKIKKILITLTSIAFSCASLSILSYDNKIKSNETGEEFKNTETKIDNLFKQFDNLKMEYSFNFISKDQLEVKIFLVNSGEKTELNDMELVMKFDENVFKFTNKNYDIFKTKSKRLDNHNDRELKFKEISFLIKKNKKLELNPKSKKEIIKFTLDIKNKSNKEKSNVDFLFKFGDSIIQEISEEVKIPQKTPIIEKISVLGLDKDIDFDKDTFNYDVYIPSDNKEIAFEITRSLNGINEIESIHFEINPNHPRVFKVGKYKIKVHKIKIRVEKDDNKKKSNSKIKKLEHKNIKKKIKIRKLKKIKIKKPKKTKTLKLKKIKKQKKAKIRKKVLKSILKKSKSDDSNQEPKIGAHMFDFIEDEDDEYEYSENFKNNKKENEKSQQNENITDKISKNDMIKLCVGSSISTLILLFLFSKLGKIIKSKRKNNTKE